MARNKEWVIDYLRQAQSKERAILRLFDSMIECVDDPESLGQLQKQKDETFQRERLLQKRLADYDVEDGLHQNGNGSDGTNGAGPVVQAGHLTEHLHVSYALLERMARQAGDKKTAAIARQNLEAEQGIAQRISANLDEITRSSRFDSWFD
jgi:ferritin-like metal-binding protein YciE